MKFEKAYNYILEESKINLIYESVYANEIFEDLIDFITYNIEHFPFYVKLTYEKLNELIQVKWKLKNHLDKSKVVYVCISDEINVIKKFLSLSDNETEEILSRIRQNEATFASDLSVNDNVSLIVISEELEHNELKRTLFHEVIHFLQWNTGRKIYDVLDENGLDISDEDAEEIGSILSIDSSAIKNMLKYFFNPEEREAYYESIFNECIRILGVDDRRQRKTFKWFIQMFKNENSNTFEEYFDHIAKEINDFKIDIRCFRNREMKLMLIYGYFKIGFTSLLNHLLGYFDKRF